MHLQPPNDIDHIQISVQVFVNHGQRLLVIPKSLWFAPAAVHNLPEYEAFRYGYLIPVFLWGGWVVDFAHVPFLAAASASSDIFEGVGEVPRIEAVCDQGGSVCEAERRNDNTDNDH